MNLPPEVIREIRAEVRRAMNVLLNAKLGESTTEDQELIEPVPGGPKMDKRPVVHPYGLCSRAPAGKIGVTGRVGEHPGARILLGVRDDARADLALAEGEVVLYNEHGQNIFLKEGQILLGDDTSDNPAVLGTELAALLGAILDALIQGDLFLVTSFGNPTAPNPAAVAVLQQAKATYVTTAGTNILSQETFLRRGGA